MRIVRISKNGNYTWHGIGNTEHSGYSGTADNGWSIKMATQIEVTKTINPGEQYRIEVNGLNKGIFVKEEVR